MAMECRETGHAGGFLIGNADKSSGYHLHVIMQKGWRLEEKNALALEFRSFRIV